MKLIRKEKNSTIYKDTRNGIDVAIKMLVKAKRDCEFLALNEIKILKFLDSPYVIKILDSFEDNETISIVLELGSLDLYSYVGKVTEEKALDYVKEIAKGLMYIHSKGVMHCDIKPENILFVGEKLKLIDFGFALKFKEGEKFNIFRGTPYYLAPEIINKVKYDYRIDIWCLGIIYYELIGGGPPFDGKTDKDVYEKILSLDIYFDDRFSENTQRNILKILKYCPWARVELLEILDFKN